MSEVLVKVENDDDHFLYFATLQEKELLATAGNV